VVVVLNPELAMLPLLLLMVAVIATLAMIPDIATLITAQLIATWVSGPAGASAPSPAVVAPDTAPVESSLLLATVARNVITPAKMKIATQTIAQLIAI
jgi:hypothetical protein